MNRTKQDENGKQYVDLDYLSEIKDNDVMTPLYDADYKPSDAMRKMNVNRIIELIKTTDLEMEEIVEILKIVQEEKHVDLLKRTLGLSFKDK